MTESPCVGICILEGDVCIGCGRTSEEIYSFGLEHMQREQEQADAPRPSLTPVPLAK